MNEKSTSIIESQEILEFLPHRYPFLLVDRVIDYQEMHSIVGIKNVTINEPFFQGHFPGIPIMPGVLIVESMAQLGGILLFKTIPDRDTKLVFFAGIENARFRRPVRPGDQLRLEMNLLQNKKRLGKLKGEAFVEDKRVAEAEILFSLVDKQSLINR
ncbi:MAG: 3-hydroxyacyl-ACP dehydratase FabZ [Acidobacteriota bacterium]|nr:3-hydroxyacyl-ACP dehydratase FabZ [Acidobacteriota bacterium]